MKAICCLTIQSSTPALRAGRTRKNRCKVSRRLSFVVRFLKMRHHTLLLFLTRFPVSAVAELPDLVCQELKVAHVDPRTLKSTEYESRTLYRFKSGKLFLSSPERSEYLYNAITEIEYHRFVSGHMTIIFEDSQFERVIFVHVNRHGEVQVSRAKCIRT